MIAIDDQHEEAPSQSEQQEALIISQQVEELDITVGRSKVDREDNSISESATTKSNQTEPPASLDEVEEILNYRFRNKRLLEEAFTHCSYPNATVSYKRLGYVGDSVLNLIVTREQYSDYPDLSPGALTRLRAANVDTEKLARVAIKHELHRFLRHKKPLLGEQIEEFKKAIEEYPLHSNGLVVVPKVLADIVESTIGAVFVDCNSIDIVWKVFEDILKPRISPETLKKHPVTELYEECQKRNLKLRFVDQWKESMAFDVFIDDQLVGKGIYGLKKEIALNRAAKDALVNILKFFVASQTS